MRVRDRRGAAHRDRDDRRSAARAAEDRRTFPRTVTVVSPTEFRVEGVPPEQDAGVPSAAHRHRADLQPFAGRRQRTPSRCGRTSPTSCARKPSPRRCRRSTAASTSSAWPSRSSRGTARTIRFSCSCRASPTSARAKEIIRSTALLELKLVEQGPFSDEAQARQAYGNNLPPDLQILPGTSAAAAPGERPATVYYVVRRVPAVTGRDLRNARPSLDENSRPAVSFSLNNEGAAQVRRVHRRQHQPPARDRARQPRLLGAEHQQPHRRRRASSRAASRSRKSADLSLVLRSGALPASLTYLEERTVGPSLGPGVDPRGRDGGGRRPVLRDGLHARLLQAGRPQRDRLDRREPDRAARADVVSRRDR